MPDSGDQHGSGHDSHDDGSHGHHMTAEERKLMESYQSLDYDIPPNALYRKERMGMDYRVNSTVNVARWLVFAAIGVLTGTLAFGLSKGVDFLFDVKFSLIRDRVHAGQLAVPFILFLLVSIGFVTIATFLVAVVEPAAGGSGIPEAKALLNGTNLPQYLTMKTLVVKAVGVMFSVAAGLAIGKEGPLVHSGAIFAANISHLTGAQQLCGCGDDLASRGGEGRNEGAGSPRKKRARHPQEGSSTPLIGAREDEDEGHQDDEDEGGPIDAEAEEASCWGTGLRRWVYRFRNDKDKRDFVSGGCAAGVAAAFGSPVGGILFSLEEASSFWSIDLTWRAFLCSMLGTFFLNVWKLAENQQGSFQGLISFGPAIQNVPFRLWELPFFVVIACFGGMHGALFNAINERICRWRRDVLQGAWAPRMGEAILVAAATATAAFWAPYFFPRCRVVPDADEALMDRLNVNFFSRYQCGEGEYNTMASMLFTTNENAIKGFFHNTAVYDWDSLLAYYFIIFALAVVTYGIAVPSGLFVPCILMGCAFGRLFGEGMRYCFPNSSIVPGTYALIGATSSLGGVARMTISLTVILLETTNDVQFITPIMVCLMVSKWVGDLFNISLYDLHVELKCMPFVESAPSGNMFHLTAGDVMRHPVISVRAKESVRRIVRTLASCKHSGFPVVALDKGEYHAPTAGHKGGSAGPAAKQRQLEQQSHSDGHIAEGKVSGLDGSGSGAASAAASELALETSGAQVTRASGSYKFVGMVLRNQLAVLLKAKAWGDGDDAMGRLSYDDFATSLSSKDVDIDLSEVPEGAMDKKIDMRPIMNPVPISVQLQCPLSRVFVLFRSLGIRHLCVVDSRNEVQGIITRKEIMSSFDQDLF